MASDRYGSACWAEAKDLKSEGVKTILAARVAKGDGENGNEKTNEANY